MSSKLMDLFVEVSAKGVNQVKGSLEQLEQTGKKVNLALDFMKGALMTFGGMMVINSIKNMVKEFTDYAESIDKAHKITGIATDELQRLKYAADQESTSFESLSNGLKLLTRNMSGAKDETTGTGANFKRLGIEIRNADGSLRDVGDVFMDLVDKIKNTHSETEASAIALQALSKNGSDLVPLMKLGRDGIAALGDEAERMGKVLDEKTIKQGKELEDTFRKLESSAKGLLYQALTPFVPALNTFAQGAAELTASFMDWEWLIPTITEMLTGQQPKVNVLTREYDRLDGVLQDIAEKSGKYSIALFTKMMEIDKKMAELENALVKEEVELVDARTAFGDITKEITFLMPQFQTAVTEATGNALVPERDILEEMAPFLEDQPDQYEKIAEALKALTLVKQIDREATQAQGDALHIYTEEEKEFWRQYEAAIQLQREMDEAAARGNARMNEQANILASMLAPAWEGFFETLVFGEMTWSEYAESVVQSIARMMVKMLAMAALAETLNLLIPGFGGFMKALEFLGGFQTPSGDWFAQKEGRDFGRMFATGYQESMSRLASGISRGGQQEPLVIYAEPGIIVERLSSMPFKEKRKLHKDVTQFVERRIS